MAALYSLCVGVATYKNAPPIPPAEKEALAVHLRLVARGARSTLLTGRRATLKRFKDELAEIRDRAVPGDLVLVYFNGHGGQPSRKCGRRWERAGVPAVLCRSAHRR
jgi:hypothetical protein